MGGNNIKRKILFFILTFLVTFIDILVKFFAISNFKNKEEKSIFLGLLKINYVENYGATLGIFRDNKNFLIFVSLFFLLAYVIYILNTKELLNKAFFIASFLIIGGGFGNLINRIYTGYVIDYIKFPFFSPVCNFADCCITAGVFIFLFNNIFFTNFNNKHTIKGKKSDAEY